MPICQNCGKKWTWNQTIRTLFRLKCPHCGKKQYESASSRLRGGVLAVFSPITLLPINYFLGFSVGMVLIIGIIMVLLIFAFYPFILKLSNEEEPYW